MKFLKVGRVAIITRGRYAGKKVRKYSEHSRITIDGRERKGEGDGFGRIQRPKTITHPDTTIAKRDTED
jgi:hypothetical protein